MLVFDAVRGTALPKIRMEFAEKQLLDIFFHCSFRFKTKVPQIFQTLVTPMNKYSSTGLCTDYRALASLHIPDGT